LTHFNEFSGLDSLKKYFLSLINIKYLLIH